MSFASIKLKVGGEKPVPPPLTVKLTIMLTVVTVIVVTVPVIVFVVGPAIVLGGLVPPVIEPVTGVTTERGGLFVVPVIEPVAGETTVVD